MLTIQTKTIFIFICTLFLSYAPSLTQAAIEKTNYKPYKTEKNAQIISAKRYVVEPIQLNFRSRVNPTEFLTQEKILELYTEKLNTALKNQDLLADQSTEQPIHLRLVIDQRRIFAGEAFGAKLTGKYAHTEFQYHATLLSQGNTVATFQSEKYLGMGKHGNFGKIFRDLSGQGKPEHELEEIDAFSKLIIEQLPK